MHRLLGSNTKKKNEKDKRKIRSFYCNAFISYSTDSPTPICTNKTYTIDTLKIKIVKLQMSFENAIWIIQQNQINKLKQIIIIHNDLRVIIIILQ